MKASTKRRATGTILLLITATAICAIVLLLNGYVPETVLSKAGSEITASITGLIGLLCISMPWNMFEKEVKPARRPAPKDHPVWNKRVPGDPKYGTIKQEEPHNFLRKVA